uniref:Uncharacterized protein n=1 Tax=Knipowitschia caucasica TaxID=637954 RepID=A0AAV2JXQ3_KNICA
MALQCLPSLRSHKQFLAGEKLFNSATCWKLEMGLLVNCGGNQPDRHERMRMSPMVLKLWSNTLLKGFKCLYSRNLLHWNIILLKGLKYLGSLDLLLWCQKLPLL